MKNKLLRSIYTILFLPGFSVALPAQDGGNSGFYDAFLANGLLLLAGLVLLGALIALVSVLNAMVKAQQIKIYQEQGLDAYLEETKKPRKNIFQNLYKQLTKVVPVEKEADIMFDHEYDGIRELDNSLPPWWVYMFYITIAFAAVYMVYYHFAGIGLSSQELYEQEMAEAEEAVQAYRALQAAPIDETNVVALDDEAQLSIGKSLYETNCVACHGVYGEGGVGPNLTDDYWIHGGTINDVFKTIKYGVPEKGMISWQAQLRPKDMQQVSSYIMTLVGTNPPNPKEPQGEKFAPADTPETQTTQPDSTQQADAIGMRE